MNTTRQQHYVWAYYLEAWEIDGKLQAMRHRSTPFSVSANKVAKQRDFYRLRRLESIDFEFIRANINAMGITDIEKKIAFNWLKPMQIIQYIEDQFSEREMPPEIKAQITALEIEIEEKFHSSMESSAVTTIGKIRNNDIAFWKDGGEEAMQFAFFISVQHLRTKRMADNMAQGIPEGFDRGVVERTWPYLKFMYATNIGKSLYIERDKWSLRIIESDGDKPFITSDQPIANLLEPDHHYGMALYYPLSPKQALLIEHDSNDKLFDSRSTLDDETVSILNAKMADLSHELIIADDAAVLLGHGAVQEA